MARKNSVGIANHSQQKERVSNGFERIQFSFIHFRFCVFHSSILWCILWLRFILNFHFHGHNLNVPYEYSALNIPFFSLIFPYKTKHCSILSYLVSIKQEIFQSIHTNKKRYGIKAINTASILCFKEKLKIKARQTCGHKMHKQ